ncbi:MAG: class I SAM-dependent methyltransferase [Mariniblastus sp.]
MPNDPIKSLIRLKKTEIDNPLPPVAKMVDGKQLAQWHFDLQGNEVKLEYADLIAKDPWPLPQPIDREGYHTVENSHYYWSSGLMDWLNVESAIKEFKIGETSGNEPGLTDRPIRILDFGCSSGRVLRHMLAFGKSEYEIWGADLGHENIEWMKRHLPNDIKSFSNTAIPNLPIADNFFDVVTGFSVFPHFEFLSDAWLLELCRITRREGLVYLTIANEATWLDSVNRESTINYFTRTNVIPGNEPMTKSSFETIFDGPLRLRRTSTEDVFNCYIWHKNEFIEHSWSRFLRVHRIVDFAHLRHQAVVLAQPAIG